MQKFYKGRTNNHLTWVMVDATDFATPESALSAAMTIKIYGKLRSGTGTNLVSSGTGSLTNDITHVGASALGLYTIALAKADLSDASAAWYDQYIISLSGTGAARQVLVVDGGIDDSYVSNVVSYLSNVNSYLSNVNSYLSNFESNLSVIASDILSAARGNSDAISDVLSRVNSASFLSDIASHVWAAKYTANSAASSFGSLMSDVYSRLVLTQSSASDAKSAASQANSRVLLVQSRLSDFDSRLVSDVSDMYSMLTALSGMVSDAYSAAVVAQTVSASDMSDIASRVWSAKYTANSVASSFGSLLSDIYSRAGGAVTASDISDIASAVWAAKYTAHSAASSFGSLLSDIYSRAGGAVTASDISDIASAVKAAMASDISDIYSLLSDLHSDVTVMSGVTSDIYSLLSDVSSDLTVMSGVTSDIYSGLATIADSVLNRDLAGGGSGNTRNVRNALRANRNKVATAAGILRVYQEDDTTVAFSAATSTAAGNPIVSIDPT